MGATPVTTAVGCEAAFPAPKIPVGLAQDGGGFENGQVGGDGIQNFRGKSGTQQRVLKSDGAFAKAGVVAMNVFGHLPGITPLGGIEDVPLWRRTTFGLVPTCRRRAGIRLVTIREVPGNDDGNGEFLARCQRSFHQNGAAIATAPPGINLSVIGQETSRIDLAP